MGMKQRDRKQKGHGAMKSALQREIEGLSTACSLGAFHDMYAIAEVP
jgi:hypothetical protein